MSTTMSTVTLHLGDVPAAALMFFRPPPSAGLCLHLASPPTATPASISQDCRHASPPAPVDVERIEYEPERWDGLS